MVSVRDKKRLKDPPPEYTPRGVYLTVGLQWGGEFKTFPIPHYYGGNTIKLDWVTAQHLGWDALVNSVKEYCGEPVGKIRKFYFLIGNVFRLLSTDEEVRIWATKHIPLREFDIYIDDVEVDDNDFGGDNVEVSHNVDSDRAENDDVEEVVENLGGKAVEKGKEKVLDDSELEYFSDSDYNMIEESGSDDDDALFEKNICEDEETRVVNDSNGEDSDSDCDVVVADRDFDEFKDSDSEQTGPNYPVFNPNVMYDSPEFELGMIFSNRHDFKKAVQTAAIESNRSVIFTKNAPERVYARCMDRKCPWKLTLLKVSNEETYQIRDYCPKHTCAPSFKVKNVKSTWICEKFVKKISNEPSRKVSGFREDVVDDIGCDVSKHQAFRAKRLALKKLEGNPNAQYSKLWDYADELRRTNPGSTVIVASEIDDNGDDRFNRLYVCLHAAKKGFASGCRPIIGVDGCHLKGPHKGILLTAVSVDANNSLYPIAWAVVNTECRETWEWFLICLKHDLEIFRSYEYTFMSDKQKGLIQAFGEVFPDSQHRFCVRHLHGNFKTAGYRGLAYKEALWKAAFASTIAEWKTTMEELKELNLSAWEWLNAKPANQWSKSHFSEHPKCDMLLNNVCESFNATILEARQMPILTMLEWIREWLMMRFQFNRDVAATKWKGRICPKIRQIINKHIMGTANCIPIKCDNFNYQVRVKDGTQFCVNLEEHTCTCKIWDLSGIPCRHAISAITHQHGDIEDYVSDWYTIDCYKRSYAPSIKGINGDALWLETCFIPPLPPNMGRGKGRPARARRNEPDEPEKKSKKKGKGRKKTALKRRQSTITCRECGFQGHNSKSCRRGDQGRTSIGGSSVNRGKRRDKRNNQGRRPLNELETNEEHPRQSMLPPLPVSQEPISAVLDDEIPTQQSQSMAKVPGPTSWDQLQLGKRPRGVQIGGPTSGGKKFRHLSTLQNVSKRKK